jgi:hypothetical protein
MNAAQPWLGLALTAILNTAFAVVAGGVASLWMLHRAPSAWSRLQSASTVTVLKAALMASVGAFALLLWTAAADLFELGLVSALGSIGTVALRTHVGHAWLLGTSALVLSIGVAFSHKHLQGPAELIGAASGCALVFAGAKSWMGHAGASGELLPLMVDWVHLVSVSVWAGAVFLGTVVVLRAPLPSAVAIASSVSNHSSSPVRSARRRSSAPALLLLVLDTRFLPSAGLFG